MCGITGEYRFDRNKVAKLKMEKQLDLINHRGPDGRGVFLRDHVGLGHVRLSILELSEAGAQPMLDRSKEFVLSYNGETYNYEDLRTNLNSSYKYQGASDTEVVLNGVIELGNTFIKQMEGMFAFAFYDIKNDEMLLARDPFGIKPLYYHKNENRIIFSSEIKPLLIDDEVDVEADEESIKEHLILGYALEPKTAFKNIYKLSPGHLMTINKNGVKTEKYWDIKEILIKNKTSFSKAFKDSVLKHTMADVPLGMFLSGGFDSNIILQSLYKLKKIGKNFRAYNVGSEIDYKKENNLFSERSIAVLSSKKFDIELVKVNVEGQKFISFDEAIKTVEEPICNPSNILIDHITKLSKEQGNKVLLSGHGGDEAFGGYRRYVAIKYLKYIKNPGGRFLLKKIKRRLGSNLYNRLIKSIAKQNKVPHFDLISLGNEAIDTYRCLGNFIDDNDVEKIKDKISNIIKPYKKHTLLKQLMILDFQSYLCAQNLINMDKFSMKNSVEVRVPFLYRPLVSVGLSAKDNDLIKNKKTKVLIRDYAKKSLPEEIQKIKKSGFSPSLTDLAKSKEVSDILFSERTKKRSIIDTDNLKQYLNKESKFTESDAMVVLNYTYVEQWYRTFIDDRTWLNNN